MWSGEIKLNFGKKIVVGVIKMTGTFVALNEPDVTTKVNEKTSTDDFASASGYISINE